MARQVGAPLGPLSSPIAGELFEHFKAADINEVALELQRIDRGNLFFSQDAVSQLHDEMLVFVGARMMRRYEDTGRTPAKMVVEIKVRFDDDAD